MIIYKTINKINNKIYIGKDTKNNPNYYGSGVLINIAIKKYGKENFTKEILQECFTIEELNNAEIYWITKLKSTDKKIGYNISTGGDGGDVFTYNPNKEEYRKKLSKSCSGELNGMYGKKHTDETKKKISEHHKTSPEFRISIINASYKWKGKKNSKISENKKKYYENIENRTKTSDALKEYYKSETKEQKEDRIKKRVIGFKKFKDSKKYDDYIKNMSETIKKICTNNNYIKKLSNSIKIGLKENLIFNFILKNNISINKFISIMKNKDNRRLLQLKRKYNAINIQFSIKSFYNHFKTIDCFLEKFLKYKKDYYEN